LGIRNRWILEHLTTNLSLLVHLTASKIATADYHSEYQYILLMSSILKSSRHTLNCILLKFLHYSATFFPLFLFPRSYHYCLYTLCYNPHRSIMIAANETYTQRGEELLFAEQSWSMPPETTCIQDSSPSSLIIQHLLSNYLSVYVTSRMTNVPNIVIERPAWYQSVNWWWRKWPERSVYFIVEHRRRWFGLPAGGHTSEWGMPGPVIINYKVSTAKEMEPYQCCYYIPSAPKSLKTTCLNGTTTTQTPNVIPPQQTIFVSVCTICPGAATTQF